MNLQFSHYRSKTSPIIGVTSPIIGDLSRYVVKIAPIIMFRLLLLWQLITPITGYYTNNKLVRKHGLMNSPMFLLILYIFVALICKKNKTGLSPHQRLMAHGVSPLRGKKYLSFGYILNFYFSYGPIRGLAHCALTPWSAPIRKFYKLTY